MRGFLWIGYQCSQLFHAMLSSDPPIRLHLSMSTTSRTCETLVAFSQLIFTCITKHSLIRMKIVNLFPRLDRGKVRLISMKLTGESLGNEMLQCLSREGMDLNEAF